MKSYSVGCELRVQTILGRLLWLLWATFAGCGYQFQLADDNKDSMGTTETGLLSDSKDITQFSLLGIDGTIGTNTVELTVPHLADLVSLTPTITHTGASIFPLSGAANNFTAPVEYTVTAEDSSTKVYTVTVSVDVYCHWRSIVINHEKVGKDNSGTLPATGFPVLIHLSGDWLKTTTADALNGRIENDKGYDIGFRGSDGETKLFHEVENYDGISGTLVAWVRIDSLSKSTDTTIYILYGNPSISAPTEEPKKVWDADYKGVWHLNNSGAGVANEFVDSSASGNHGQGGDGDRGKTPTRTTGTQAKIDGAQNFDGLDDFIDLGNPSELDFGTGDWAVSCWSRASPTGGSSRTVYAKGGDVTGGIRYLLSNWNGSAETMALVTDDNSTKYTVESRTKASDGGWHYLVGLRHENTLRLYVDGIEEEAQSVSGEYDLSGTSQWNAYIGAIMDYSTNTLFKFASGMIDEVRVSSSARSADWIITSYNNQNDTAVGDDQFIKSLGVEN